MKTWRESEERKKEEKKRKEETPNWRRNFEVNDDLK